MPDVYKQQLSILAKLFVFVLASCLLIACVTVGSYQTVVLNEAFESGANRINVKAPVRRYRDSFFNVALGPYQVENTSIGKTLTSKRGDTPDRVTTEDDTLWNLIFNQELKAEKVTYQQYRISQISSYAFQIIDSSDRAVAVNCRRESVLLENEEVSRVSVGIDSISIGNLPGDKNAVQRYGEWLGSQLRCSVESNLKTWSLESITSAESNPAVTLSSAVNRWKIHMLDYGFADQPWIAAREPTDELGPATGDAISGVAFSSAGLEKGAVSLSPGNTAIWLDTALPAVDSTMLIATSYALILNNWLTE